MIPSFSSDNQSGNHAFIQALVYDRFSQKDSVYALFACSVARWVGMKKNVSNFRSADRWEMDFSRSFRGILEFFREF